jgi:hypothetical protein
MNCRLVNRYVQDGTIKAFRISEGPDDPAGDADPEGTCAEAMISVIDQLKKNTEL